MNEFSFVISSSTTERVQQFSANAMNNYFRSMAVYPALLYEVWNVIKLLNCSDVQLVDTGKLELFRAPQPGGRHSHSIAHVHSTTDLLQSQTNSVRLLILSQLYLNVSCVLLSLSCAQLQRNVNLLPQG
jgi:hypothetical protein